MITKTLPVNPNEKHQEKIHTNNVSILLTNEIINWRQRSMLKISSAHKSRSRYDKIFTHYYGIEENFKRSDTF